MASPGVSQLVLATLQSTRGQVALLALAVSLVIAAYTFLFKASKPTGKHSSAGKPTSRSRAWAAKHPKAPKKLDSKPTKMETKAKKSGGAGKKETTAKKSPAKSTGDATAASKGSSAPKQASVRQASSKSQSKVEKDDGEWITVATKKKPRPSSAKKSADDKPVSSRSSPRKTAQRS